MAGSMVDFQSNGGTTQGYLARPASGSGPGVIVVQEWWGLVDHIKDLADRFAAEGFVALAPDFYHGQRAGDPSEAGKLMMALNIGQTEKDLRGAVQYLLGQGASSQKVGVVGFCMGGQLALLAACENPQVGACVDYYGVHPAVKPDVSKLSGPVQVMVAEHDEYTTRDVAEQLKQQASAAGKSLDYTYYPGTSHAFFNDTRMEVYNESAAKDSWNRTLTLFRDNLK